VRGVGDFQLDHGILVAVGVGDGLLGGSAALGENHVVVRHVFEHNEAIVLGMDSFFHVFSFVFCRFKQWLLNDCYYFVYLIVIGSKSTFLGVVLRLQRYELFPIWQDFFYFFAFFVTYPAPPLA